MTEQERVDRHDTDEPDGTAAHAASLRPPGTSVTGAAAEDDGTDDDSTGDPGDTGDDEFGDAGDEPAGPFAGSVLPGESRAGYDVDAVAGDTDLYRPDE